MTRSFEPYARVRVLSDLHDSEGVQRGALGYIIEIWSETALEVQVFHRDGCTSTLITVHPDELEAAPEDPI
jgi:hypothetical protein